VLAERIFIGVEATGHYYEDIVRELGKCGYGVTIINAATTYETLVFPLQTDEWRFPVDCPSLNSVYF
jgi:hypothetical protein